MRQNPENALVLARAYLLYQRASRLPQYVQLLEELIAGAEATGIWTIQTSIFPENHASLALHEHCGFRVVGTRERVAKRDGIWRDTVFLERRSRVIS